MREKALSDNGGERLNSGAGTPQSEYFRFDHSFIPGERVRGSFVRFDKMGETKQEFDELLLEHGSNGVIWLHFAVRPPGQQNRRKISFLKA